MGVRFRVVDPRGYTVVCDEFHRANHILQDHPEMAEFEQDVKLAIEQASYIFKDAVFKNREIYYRKITPRLLVKVVVEQVSLKPGYIVTAFVTNRCTDGELLIWP